MEKDQIQKQKYALSLQSTIQGHYHYLKGSVEEFQEKCQRVSPGKKVPLDIINQIREAYKAIRDRLNEVRAIQQLLQTKYRQYYHRDPLLEKEIPEFEFISKNCYSKVEYTLKEIEAKKKMERERLALMSRKNEPPRGTF
jgi:hypothetical protein